MITCPCCGHALQADGLTPTQAKALEFIKGFIAERGYSPSFREIMVGLGYESTCSVHRVLQMLVERGHIAYQRARRRSLVVL
jgi:repressor LexA